MAEINFRPTENDIAEMENMLSTPAGKAQFESMTSLNAADYMDDGGLTVIEAVQVQGAMGNAMGKMMGKQPDPELLEQLKQEFATELEDGSITLETLEGSSIMYKIKESEQQPQQENRRNNLRRGADANEQPDGELVVAFVNPDTNEVVALGGAAKAGETTAHTEQVDNAADYAEIAGADIPKLDDLG